MYTILEIFLFPTVLHSFFYNNEDNKYKNTFFPYEDNAVKLCKENTKFNSKIGMFFIIHLR